eukprot:TRINITY_DN1735_c0_g1_i3.p1 TRINITY_DN1735_c0_g1~~TRINITY_DN1735_c0_g1_i3.p1  ORF type:complete len:404 (-),score=76.15 TRINITY_DN1735_c0_g1_i3:60-1112(-)
MYVAGVLSNPTDTQRQKFFYLRLLWLNFLPLLMMCIDPMSLRHLIPQALQWVFYYFVAGSCSVIIFQFSFSCLGVVTMSTDMTIKQRRLKWFFLGWNSFAFWVYPAFAYASNFPYWILWFIQGCFVLVLYSVASLFLFSISIRTFIWLQRRAEFSLSTPVVAKAADLPLEASPPTEMELTSAEASPSTPRFLETPRAQPQVLDDSQAPVPAPSYSSGNITDPSPLSRLRSITVKSIASSASRVFGGAHPVQMKQYIEAQRRLAAITLFGGGFLLLGIYIIFESVYTLLQERPAHWQYPKTAAEFHLFGVTQIAVTLAIYVLLGLVYSNRVERWHQPSQSNRVNISSDFVA